MAYSRAIPNYALYGDQAPPAWASLFNFEWIPQRSAPYQWTIQPHRHDAFVQLLYLTAGSAEVQIDDAVHRALAPCLVLIPAGHVHGFHFASDVDGPVVTATQKTLESLASVVMPELLPTLRRPRVVGLQDEMRYVDQLMPLFLALERESRTPASGQVAASMSLLMALMVQIDRLCQMSDVQAPQAGQPSSRKARQIERFRGLVDQHFRVQRSVPFYAGALSITAGQLTRLCRECLGLSSLDVINARILHEAQRELVYTHLPVKQLAADLGFEDDAYFSRFFRKHTGLSPKAFRARALEQIHETPAEF
ncbi:helix-turn-helix domain-containing protein [Hydrogenophaga sp. OTU3427]|uniref:helix-turn-helix domain-containing protein n=1 Tax=Hydrogenophaga sp. OTU3427 TaxID=3043856 RepID=UPI00313CC1B4